MNLNRWVLGAATAGFVLGAGSAQAAPLSLAPMNESLVQTVQFFFEDEPPPVYYDPPPRPYYRDYPPQRDYYPAPRRDFYQPGPYYGNRVRNGPPPRYAQPSFQPPRGRGRPPAYYTKDQVRAWNRANGF